MYYVKGNFVQPGGLLGERTELLVERGQDGVYRHAELGCELSATKFVESWGSYTRIVGEDVVWEFSPDDGECERIGMPVAVETVGAGA